VKGGKKADDYQQVMNHPSKGERDDSGEIILTVKQAASLLSSN
jgi:hypothetical protein